MMAVIAAVALVFTRSSDFVSLGETTKVAAADELAVSWG
jgi:hypothetical protein